MTPIEKAKELVRNFKGRGMDGDENYASKECALIVVDEIIKDRERLDDSLFYDGNYWMEVKKEIELL